MFGFPSVPRENFANTFIRKVEFTLTFDLNNESTLSDCAKESFENEFPNVEYNLTKDYSININEGIPTVQEHQEPKGIKLLSPDRKVILLINNGVMRYIVDGANYHGYEDMKARLSALTLFFNKLDVVAVKQISLQKTNIFGFETTNNPIGTLNDLISPELIGNTDYFPNSQFVKQNINTVIYQNANEQLNLIYGLSVSPQETDNIKGQIIVDINRLSEALCPITNIWNQADSMNSEIFNVFSWAISNKAKQLLKG